VDFLLHSLKMITVIFLISSQYFFIHTRLLENFFSVENELFGGLLLGEILG